MHRMITTLSKLNNQHNRNRSDRQEESDRSNQGVASPDYAETLITFHAFSNHHVLIDARY